MIPFAPLSPGERFQIFLQDNLITPVKIGAR